MVLQMKVLKMKKMQRLMTKMREQEKKNKRQRAPRIMLTLLAHHRLVVCSCSLISLVFSGILTVGESLD